MSDSEHWRERDRRVLWHPFTQQRLWADVDFPVITAGEGVYLEDADGRRYLDGVSSLWLNVHGHKRPEIDEAVKRQMDRVSHSTFLGLSHPPGIELAERLVELTPPGVSRVFYSDDGSTAMEIALKMAYQYHVQADPPAPERHYFVTLRDAYHGDTIGSVSLGGIDLFHQVYRPLLFPAISAPKPDCRRCRVLSPERAEACRAGSGCLDAMDAILSERARETAAVVIEPRVQGAAGMIVQPEGFVLGVRKLCDKHGVLMIADEVATGFGRTGEMFACQKEGVTPDIMASGKGITGGYLPLAATMTTEAVFERFLGPTHGERTFFHGHSYTGNQLGCAAAIANLDLFAERGILENVRERAARAESRRSSFESLAHVGEFRREGLMMGLHLESDPARLEAYPPEAMTARKVILKAREKGVIIRPLGDTVILMPPLCIGEEDLDKLLEAAHESIEEVTEG